MATMRLVASKTAVSNASYAAVANANNMYTNTDSTTYGTFTHNRANTNSTYYGYIRGFNFSSIPSDAEVTSFTVKIKASATGHTTSTSSSYYMSLVNNTTQIGSTSASGRLTTSTTTFTFANGSLTWSTIYGYGSNFGIRIPLRRASSNIADVVSVYGAEIEVTYTVPDPRTITSTLDGSGTISPSGATTKYDGDEYTLTITPTNTSDTVTITNNNVDVTEDLEPHYTGGTSTSYSTASGSGVTTGFARSNSQFYRGNSSTTGDDWLRYAIGHTAESPYSTSNTSNTYCKDGTNDATTQGWMNYPFSFSNLPNDAEVTAVEVKVYGAAEDPSETASHADVSLWCGNTQKGSTYELTNTSNASVTVTDPGTWTREELQDAWVRFGVGYYGGRILGITWKVTYTYGGTLHHYTYTYTVNGNATIAVNIGGAVSTKKIYIKESGTETLVASKYVHDFDSNYTISIDLSSFQNGNICHLVGEISIEQYGITSNVVSVDGTFVWSDTNEYVATDGTNSYTLQLFSNGIKIISPQLAGSQTYQFGQSYNVPFLIYKSTGGWTQYSKVYKKINGSWVQQAESTWTTVLPTGSNYTMVRM